jgi:glycerophosphoryl diester phosphodiesterase
VKPFLARPRPYLIAHRGGARLAPENTLAAFDGARALGADAVELDVRLTADGEVIVFHDETTERVTGTPGTVADRSFGELEALDAGHAFTPDRGRSFPWRGRGLAIPALSAVFARYPGMLFNIEAKDPSPQLAEALARAVRAAGRVHAVCVGSSDDAQAGRIRELLPEACHFLPEGAAACHVLAAKGVRGDETCPGGYDVADLPQRLEEGVDVVDAAVVRWFHARGVAVHVWTVDDEADMRALLALDVDGIMSDRPDVLKRVLGR